MHNSRSSTIANNTIFLYIRSFVTMAIGIYTSRILLKVLGVDDYGLYNLVAGVVAMFSSLKSVFATSIQRFLNYEKGKGDAEKVKNIFNLSLIVQFCLAVLFGVVVELFGLWLINNKLSIPESSLDTAIFVFHTSIITAILTIISTPFDAAIIANEKIKIYAWIAMFDACLKLLIIYLLPLFTFKYLNTYAVLILCIGILNMVFSIWYSKRNFKECEFSLFWDKRTFKDLASFAGWNFMGNTVYAMVNEGINMILNIFGGVAINAARGIAYQVKSAVSSLGNNLIVAAQPFIMQQAASQDKEQIFGYTYRISRLMFLILLFTAFPIVIYCEHILNLWLIEPPYMSAVFVQLVLIHLIQRSLHTPIDTMFKAIGNIRNYQIVDSVSLVISLPICYLALWYGLPFYSVFVIICLVEALNLGLVVLCAKYQLGMKIKIYFKEVIIYCSYALLVYVVMGILYMNYLKPQSNLELICNIALVIIVQVPVTYLLLPKDDKYLFRKVLNNLLIRFKA